MSYRDRRIAKAERLMGWAEKRQERAAAALATGDKYRGDHAFNTQPGHIPERARLIARQDRAFESLDKAALMDSRAAGILDQVEHAIYSDDHDAIERLRERIAGLEAQREKIKTRNADFRKTHKAELKALTSAYQRDIAMPHQAYELQNLGGNISRQRARLAMLERASAPAPIPLDIAYDE